VTFTTYPGEAVGIIGRNGSGKSTLMASLAGLLPPDRGSVHTASQPVLLAVGAALQTELSGRRNIVIGASALGIPRADVARQMEGIIDFTGLREAIDRPLKTYSGGMRRRLDLAGALIGEPLVLFLDEPTTGLDPRSRTELWDTIRERVSRGTTVLLTTQYLEEADQLADEIVVIDHGRSIARGTAEQLKLQVGGEHVDVHLRNNHDLAAAESLLQRVATGPIRTHAETNELSAPVDSGVDALREVLRAFESNRIEIVDIGLRRPTLDDVFMTLTGHEATT
jgi:ABC-2 type transport system ATP-binding protein